MKTAINQRDKKEALTLSKSDEYLTPRQVVAELDKFVIGQNEAKKVVAIALRNRWRRKRADEAIRDEIMPNNIIMIGPTGVGKTEIARRLAKLAGAPFLKVEATKFTEIGYVGRDVESMIRDLVERCVSMVRAEKTKEKIEEAKTAVENRILDILIPPIQKGVSFDTATDEEVASNGRTREKFRKKLRNGELDDKLIDIEISIDSAPPFQTLGPFSADEFAMNIQDIISNISPKRKKKRNVLVSKAKQILQLEEAEKLIDMESLIKEALDRAETTGIVFIDEIDKIASKGGGSGPDVSREGVQRDILPIVEGATVNTRYGAIRTDHILFIASGAFHISKPSDLIPELQGRFPIRVELQNLTEEDFVKILTLPENALIKQYKALAASEEVELIIDDSAVKEIASIAAKVNDEVANIGARRLHTILAALLEDILYNAPDNLESKNIIINSEFVNEKLKEIINNSDTSKFIL